LTQKPTGLLLGVDGRHRLLGLAALHVEPIGVGAPKAAAFNLVAARERLHLAAIELLVPEIDRALSVVHIPVTSPAYACCGYQ